MRLHWPKMLLGAVALIVLLSSPQNFVLAFFAGFAVSWWARRALRKS